MEVIGKVKYISGDIKVSDKFTKRELVVTTDEQYLQHILINFIQDKTDLIDKLAVGDEIKVSVNLRGREWLDPKTNVNRYFNDIQGWRVEKLDVSKQSPEPVHSVEVVVNEDDSNLPF